MTFQWLSLKSTLIQTCNPLSNIMKYKKEGFLKLLFLAFSFESNTWTDARLFIVSILICFAAWINVFCKGSFITSIEVWHLSFFCNYQNYICPLLHFKITILMTSSWKLNLFLTFKNVFLDSVFCNFFWH